MKFWLCANLCLAAAGFLVSGSLPAAQIRVSPDGHRVNETLLAGLRPGRDTFAVAAKRFKPRNLAENRGPEIREWRDDCSGRNIRLKLDAKSIIRSITITTLGEQTGNCNVPPADFLDAKNWVTGLGLRIGDSQDRVTDFYGEPDASGPASKYGRELAMMSYQFGWAGSDVPQAMEVLCARDTGRVVEITLAFPNP